MDHTLERLIGELTAEVRGINRRIDDFLGKHSDLEERVRHLENALAWARGLAWAAIAAGGALGTIGGIAVKLLA